MKRRAPPLLLLLAMTACASPGVRSSVRAQPASSVLDTPRPPAPAAAPTGALAIDAAAYAMTITVGAAAITSSGATILLLGPRDQLAQHGADAQFKRSENDLLLLPLAAAAASARAADKAARNTASSTALIVLEASTPYRLFVEVLFTLGQNDFGAWDLLMPGEKRAPRRTTPPSRHTGAELDLGKRSLNLTINIVDGGFQLKTAKGNVAPGCDGTGAGLAIPTTAMGYDFSALARCVAKVKHAAPEFAEETRVTITASAGVEFATVATVMDAIRVHDGAELFPDVRFGIAR